MCIPEVVVDKVHLEQELWTVDIGIITGFFLEISDAEGILWFPFTNEDVNEVQISEWNAQLSTNQDVNEAGIVMLDSKWSLIQKLKVENRDFEKSVNWQTQLFSIINAAHA
ncbi:hypothetical protein D5952_14025 [Salmonella enterica subsp. enterica]|nr:hypothetical protein [Salmonella enterica subsp. enterica serovar Bonn]EBZ5939297.1 hypothetical protein [Salmonella enterica subsp. enterica serovar Muenchen]MLZ41041.1 hypothetical protein [Salmonella enterica subsp. enterica serovar Bonn]